MDDLWPRPVAFFSEVLKIELDFGIFQNRRNIPFFPHYCKIRIPIHLAHQKPICSSFCANRQSKTVTPLSQAFPNFKSADGFLAEVWSLPSKLQP